MEAAALLGPFILNADGARRFAERHFGKDATLDAYVTALADKCVKINKGDLKEVENMLFAQAVTLNTIFGALVGKAALNFNGGSEYRLSMETYFKLGMKAQNQCRMTLETLGNVRNPPVVYAKQANIANGPQQVNNGFVPRAPATETESAPSKILEQSHEQRMDTGTQGAAIDGNPSLETVAALHRPKDT
ncbi:MAG: hypothetical protein ACKVP5_07705 [Aestuariivirga sp.]